MCSEKNKNICCCFFNIITGILIAVSFASFFYLGIISVITAILYITLILGILGLVYVLFSLCCYKRERCEIVRDNCLISLSVGSIIISILGFFAPFVFAGSVAFALFIASLAFFLTLDIIYAIELIFSCVCKKNYCD